MITEEKLKNKLELQDASDSLHPRAKIAKSKQESPIEKENSIDISIDSWTKLDPLSRMFPFSPNISATEIIEHNLKIDECIANMEHQHESVNEESSSSGSIQCNCLIY